MSSWSCTRGVPHIVVAAEFVQRNLTADNLTVDNAKNALIFYLVFTRALKAYRHVRARGIVSVVQDAYRWVMMRVMNLIISSPWVRPQVEAEMAKAKEGVQRSLVPHGAIRRLTLPAAGESLAQILAEMDEMDSAMPEHVDYREGKLSGAVYHGGEDMEEIIVAAFKRYCVSNPLHPDAFPAIRTMEAEIVSMCLHMYNNPTGAGATTSGGTESILMAVKTHREWASATKGITEPEMIVPESAHAAFDKASAYFKIKLHTIPVDLVTRQVDLKRVRRAINPNTIMLVGSAINFPDGCQDDIVALGKLAQRYNIGLHVDCCLGSFIMPFLEKAGFSSAPFDFRIPGVTSISCDTHKYGFAPKGSSVVMYRDAELRRFQYYVNPVWLGGVYASPGLAGSRPGSLIAGTWAAMHYMGEAGYIASCRAIVGAARHIAAAITAEIPELRILGSPPASVVAFSAVEGSGVNVLVVGDMMSKKGWHLNALQNPPGLHIACTRLTVAVKDDFVRDLKEAVREAKESPDGKGNLVALYGLGTSSAIGPTMVGTLINAFLDALYQA
ncbi:PLP-dependent transferase [Vararia minispora EC-137]|uniref:PLP-dependent transferase n=1 Tax=Vararia minispora EC-137 TaxID=1314806 RepID=A0ACB8QCS5_9AGAM|nr:PLP-dependent transferase [Vararia minispora EC-137]